MIRYVCANLIQQIMNIYKISHEMDEYNVFLGHVIVARSEAEVRWIAQKTHADEGGPVWDTAIVEEIGEYTGLRPHPFIVLSDYKNE